MKARRLSWAGLGALGLLALAGCTAQPRVATSQAQLPPVEPGMARVWFFRQSDPTGGNVYAADPIVYANGAPVGEIRQGTAFFHNFSPGKYRFTVQPFGTPANLVDTLQLAPGTQAYVQVQAVPNWEMGSTAGGASFAVLTMSPQEAQAYMPLMKDLGQR